MKVYKQNLKIYEEEDRFDKDLYVRISYDTWEWARIEKGIQSNENKHDTRQGEGLQNAVLLAVRSPRIQRQWRRCLQLPPIWLFMERKERCPRERAIGWCLFHLKPPTENGTITQFNRGELLNLLYEQCVT